MKAVIFGASGQNGDWLLRLLKTIELLGVPRSRIEFTGDVAGHKFAETFIRKACPAIYLNLAATFRLAMRLCLIIVTAKKRWP